MVVEMGQKYEAPFDPQRPQLGAFPMRGGATLLIDPFRPERRTRYVILKNITSDRRLNAQAQLHREQAGSLRSTYFASVRSPERFAALHDDLEEVTHA